MKVSIALMAVICIASVYSAAPKITPEQFQRIKAEIDKCASDNNIGQEVFESLKAGNWPSPSKDWDCFSACILKHTGIMNEDGSTNYKPTDSEQGKKCKDLRGTDKCDTAGKIISCLHEHNLIHKF